MSVRRSCACPLVVSLCLCIMHPHQCQRACLPYMGWLPLRGLRLAIEGRLFCLWAVFPSISGFLFRAPCPSNSTLSSCSLARGNTTDTLQTLKTLAQTFLHRSHRGLFRAHSRASLPGTHTPLCMAEEYCVKARGPSYRVLRVTFPAWQLKCTA